MTVANVWATNDVITAAKLNQALDASGNYVGTVAGAVEGTSIDIVQAYDDGIADDNTMSLVFDFVPSKIVLQFNGIVSHITSNEWGTTSGLTVITVTGVNTITSVTGVASFLDANGVPTGLKTSNDTTNVIILHGGKNPTTSAIVVGTATWTTATKTLLITFQESNSTTAKTTLNVIATAYK